MTSRTILLRQLGIFVVGGLTGCIVTVALASNGNSSAAASDPTSATTCSEVREVARVEEAKQARQPKRPFVTRPIDLCAAADPEREQRYVEQQAVELLSLLSGRLSAMKAAAPGADPEVMVNQMALYRRGMTESIVRTAPDLIGELSDQVEKGLCDRDASDEHLLLMVRLIGDIPELASSKGLDCIFRGRDKEDIVLWSALDAWKMAGVEKTPGIEALELSAHDERTLQRLVNSRGAATTTPFRSSINEEPK